MLNIVLANRLDFCSQRNMTRILYACKGFSSVRNTEPIATYKNVKEKVCYEIQN